MKEWVAGRNPVLEALKANRRHFFRIRIAKGVAEDGRIESILNIAKAKNIPVEYVERPRLDALDTNHQGVAIETSIYPYAALQDLVGYSRSLNEPPFFLLLDALQDPQNLGTLLRTADAMRVHGVILPPAHSALITPAVVHASSGASEHLLIAQYNLAQAIKSLKEMDVWVIGLDEGMDSLPPEHLDLNIGIALVVGNEGEGLRNLVAKSCDHLMRLPMYGNIQSLNAAVAGSIALYMARASRNKTP